MKQLFKYAFGLWVIAMTTIIIVASVGAMYNLVNTLLCT